MTLLEIEALLEERGLRLRGAHSPGRGRLWTVEVEDAVTRQGFASKGRDLREAVDNAVAVATVRPKTGKKRFEG